MPSTRHGALSLPELPKPSDLGHEWPELETHLTELEKLRERLREAQRHHRALVDDERPRAEGRDRERHAKAIRADKPDPGTRLTDAVDKKIAEAERTIDATRLALEHVAADIESLVSRHRDDWLAQVEARRQSLRDEYQDRLSALEDTHRRYREQSELADLVRRFPERSSWRVRLGYVRSLTKPSGDPYPVLDVLEALRTQVEPPTRRPESPGPPKGLGGFNPPFIPAG